MLNIGLGQWSEQKLLLFAVVISIIFFLGITFWSLFSKRNKDPFIREYKRFLYDLDKLGVPTTPPQTFLQEMSSLKEKVPQLKGKLDAYCTQYIQLRLKQNQAQSTLKNLIKLIRRDLKKL